MERVLVTGATGNVGRPTLQALAGLPWVQAVGYAALHLAVRFGAEDRVDPTLERVLGRRPRAISESVADMLPLFARGP